MPTLPTLHECSASGWSLATAAPPGTIPPLTTGVNLWSNSTTLGATPVRLADDALVGSGSGGSRIADDVILTNVIGFDVKAWDPTYVDPLTGVTGGYVDLGYNNVAYAAAYANGLGHWGHPKSHLNADFNGAVGLTTARVYDTYSFHYETVGTSAADPLAGARQTALTISEQELLTRSSSMAIQASGRTRPPRRTPFLCGASR